MSVEWIGPQLDWEEIFGKYDLKINNENEKLVAVITGNNQSIITSGKDIDELFDNVADAFKTAYDIK